MRRLWYLWIFYLGISCCSFLFSQQRGQEKEEIEEEVENALVQGFYRNRQGLQESIQKLQKREEQLEKTQGFKTTGLLDNFKDLEIHLIRDSREALYAKERLLKEEEVDEVLQKRLEYHLETDPLRYIKTLEGEGFYNIFAAIFNDLSRYSFLIASGNLLAIGNSAIDLFFTLITFPEMTVHQRKILVLLEEHLKKEDSRFQEKALRQYLQELEAQRKKVALNQELSSLEVWLEEEKGSALEGLIPYLKKTYPGPEILEAVQGAEQHLREIERLRKRALFVEPGREVLDESQIQALENVLTATFKGQIQEAHFALKSAESLFHKTSFEDELWYFHSVLLEREKGRETAIQWLSTNPYPHSNMGRQSRHLLEILTYHQERAIEKAESEHTWNTVKYVFTGELTSTGSLKVLSKKLLTQSSEAGTSLGIFYGLGLLLRSVRVCFANPISEQEIIDAYIKALAVKESAQWRENLVELYEDQEEYEKALFHYRKQANPDPDVLKEYQEEIHQKWLERLSFLENPQSKEKILRQILAQNNSSEIRQSAEKALETVHLEKETEYQIPWKALQHSPEIFALFELSPQLVDGDSENGELLPEGIFLLHSGEVLLKLEEDVSRRFALNPVQLQELRAKLKQWKSEEQLKETLYHQSPYGYFPLEIYGAVGTQGVLVYPRLKQKFYANPDRQLYR